MKIYNSYRKIIHIDMDAFFASVEQLDNYNLKGKPVAVGGDGKRGVVAAASYEARKFGVKSAMSSFLARKKCPNLIFVKPRHDRYKEISLKLRNIFYQYTDLVEPLSLDEAYLDVTENKKSNSSASLIAQEIRNTIWNKLKLKASAGISINKFLAKIASNINKPNGQKTIKPKQVISFLEKLPVNKFHGIGKITAIKMHNNGIFTGIDLKQKSLEYLINNFGKSGENYYNIVRGIYNYPVKPNKIRKSIAVEKTFNINLSSEIFMLQALKKIACELEKRMLIHNYKGKSITLKIKYSDFSIQTRSKTINKFINTEREFLPIVKNLLFQKKITNSVRLLGISISNLNTKKNFSYIQLKFNF